LTIRYFL